MTPVRLEPAAPPNGYKSSLCPGELALCKKFKKDHPLELKTILLKYKPGVDPGFLERGFRCVCMGGGIRFADFLKYPMKMK